MKVSDVRAIRKAALDLSDLAGEIIYGCEHGNSAEDLTVCHACSGPYFPAFISAALDLREKLRCVRKPATPEADVNGKLNCGKLVQAEVLACLGVIAKMFPTSVAGKLAALGIKNALLIAEGKPARGVDDLVRDALGGQATPEARR